VLIGAPLTLAARQPSRFTVRPLDRERGVLLNRGQADDTVDLHLGLLEPAGARVYRRAGGPWIVRDTTGGVALLRDVVPAFYDELAAPSVIDSVLYYWGIEPDPGGGYAIEARRYDFRLASGEVSRLYSEYLEFDNPPLHQPPARDHGLIRYAVDGARLWLDEAFRVVRREGRE